MQSKNGCLNGRRVAFVAILAALFGTLYGVTELIAQEGGGAGVVAAPAAREPAPDYTAGFQVFMRMGFPDLSKASYISLNSDCISARLDLHSLRRHGVSEGNGWLLEEHKEGASKIFTVSATPLELHYLESDSEMEEMELGYLYQLARSKRKEGEALPQYAEGMWHGADLLKDLTNAIAQIEQLNEEAAAEGEEGTEAFGHSFRYNPLANSVEVQGQLFMLALGGWQKGYKDEANQLAAALEFLPKLDPQAVEACLSDPDTYVRRLAVQALTENRSKDTAKRLTQLFLDDDDLKGSVITALFSINARLPESFVDALKGKEPDLLLSVVDALHPDEADSLLLALPLMEHPNDDVACAAIRVAARSGSKDQKLQAAFVKLLTSGKRLRQLTLLEEYRRQSTHSYYLDRSTPTEERFEEILATITFTPQEAETNPLGELFAAFADTPAPANSSVAAATSAPSAADPTATISELFEAFADTPAPDNSSVVAATAVSATTPPNLRAALVALLKSDDADLRFGAACMLFTLGESDSLAYLQMLYPQLATPKRLQIASASGANDTQAAQALLESLLRDSSSEVRRTTLSQLVENSKPLAIQTIFTVAFAKESPLKPGDLVQFSYSLERVLQNASFRRLAAPPVKQLFANTANYSDEQIILALSFMRSIYQHSDSALLPPLLKHQNPFVRRAAWMLLEKQPPELFQQLEQLANDPSEWVRGVLPLLYSESSKEIIFNDDLSERDKYFFGYSRSSMPPLSQEHLPLLTNMLHDTGQQVRQLALLALLKCNQTVAPRLIMQFVATHPAKERYANAVMQQILAKSANWFSQYPKEEVRLLIDSLLTEPSLEGYQAKEGLLALRKNFSDDAYAVATDDDDEVDEDATTTNTPPSSLTPALRPDGARSQWHAINALALKNADEKQDALWKRGEGQGMRGADKARVVIFFRNPGCRECRAVAEMLALMRDHWPDLHVEERNLHHPADAELNRALSERFKLPNSDYLAAPSLFTGAGALVRTAITPQRLDYLLQQPQATQLAWRDLSAAERAEAGEALAESYQAFTPWIVLSVGLLDGINPCAFATIIFLLSYLQIARRKPAELLAVGTAFTLGLFLTYFALGLGLVEIVERFTLLQRLGQWFNRLLAAAVAIVALLSLWDGIQCLRGKIGDMVLQLPPRLSAGIRSVTRRGARARRFIIVAFAMGIVISLLELACTGQIYLPTLLYIVKSGHSRLTVLLYLGLYNFAFVLPLILIFIAASFGLRSQRLRDSLHRHAAIVKFLTAAVMLLLLYLLLRAL